MHLNTLINIVSSSATTDDKKAATIGILSNIPNYLLSYGYINLGVALAIKDKIPIELRKGRETVIGTGLARLATARLLILLGFKVTVLERRKLVGGRVYTKKMEGGNKVATADLGGSVLRGTIANPLGLLEQQLSYILHKVRDQCPIYRANRNPVDEYLDKKVEVVYNSHLDKASKLRQEFFSGLEAQIHNHYPVV
ncbi:hypothetical protein MTR67_043843 [Solanum verrucosum]|uniref:Amine oxidase domain-containing protein n=1 Tax=Solanum verrucosum TaxID=315347 RepID=A0AAF0US68_SOLVR|nr:hypothetical protein MTR67_043843 [Solanum verrucosum]